MEQNVGFSVETNQAMRALLGQEALNPTLIRGPLPSGMAEAGGVSEGFADLDGCVVPIRWLAKAVDKNRDDETGLECLLSKIHVGDFVDESTTPLDQMIRLGIAYAHVLRNGLLASRVKGPFRIIVSGLLGNDDDAATCTVRFHRRRAGQDWLNHDLEGYSREALMVWDFD